MRPWCLPGECTQLYSHATMGPVLCPWGTPPELAHDGHLMLGEGFQPLTVFLNNDPKEIFLKSCVVLGNSSELLTIRQPCYIS